MSVIAFLFISVKRMLESLVWFAKYVLHHLITKVLYNIKDENICLHLFDPL